MSFADFFTAIINQLLKNKKSFTEGPCLMRLLVLGKIGEVSEIILAVFRHNVFLGFLLKSGHNKKMFFIIFARVFFHYFFC